jgi:hypothetical protein
MQFKQIMVLAAVASIAGTGTAVAGSAYVTGRDIKNGTVTGRDIKDRSLSPRDFNGSVQGPQGAQGVQGAQGAQGPAGAAGSQGPAGSFSDIQRITQTQSVAPGQAVTIVAQCSAGYKVVGGGFYSANITFASDSFGTTTAWKVIAGNPSSTTSYDATAIAYCVR